MYCVVADGLERLTLLPSVILQACATMPDFQVVIKIYLLVTRKLDLARIRLGSLNVL